MQAFRHWTARGQLAHWGAVGISRRAYAEMEARLRRSGSGPAPETVPALPPPEGMVLGVDPSLRATGYGLVARQGDTFHAVAHGTIRCPRNWSRSECLAAIAQTFRELLETHRPCAVAVEGLFHARNARTALVMGEARGAALAVLAGAGLPIVEIAPRRVKQAITGHGAASKAAVARMVGRMLGLAEPPAADEADALALALAHWQSLRQPWAPIGRRV